MISIDTLDKMIQYGHWLSVHCNGRDCQNRAAVDLPSLAGRLGGGHPCLAKDLRPYFRCAKCGSRDIGFTTGAETRNIFAGAHTGQALPAEPVTVAPARLRRARRSPPRI